MLTVTLGHGDMKEIQRYLNPRAEHDADAIQSFDFDQLITPRVGSDAADADPEQQSVISEPTFPGTTGFSRIIRTTF
ncbi:MAG: hypothetical protein ACPGYV_06275 [Phycisphaeraceae bacterium]